MHIKQVCICSCNYF